MWKIFGNERKIGGRKRKRLEGKDAQVKKGRWVG